MKTKTLISFAVTAKLICVFVFAYAKKPVFSRRGSNCVAMAGLDMATKVFALELGPHKVRVNSVAPSIVNTKMLEVLSDELTKGYSSALPMGRRLEVNDVVHSVLFLLSNQSHMITGNTVMVEGGHTCYLPV